MQVIKRDGRVVNFSLERIISAVTKSMAQTPGGIDIDLANRIAVSVMKQLENQDQVNVYEIQDIVEKKLMGSSRKEVAQSYITYRYNRDIARKSKTKEIFLDIISAKSDSTVKENLNINSDTPAGMMMKFASETTKPFVNDYLLSNEVRSAEKDGYIHINHKDYYPTKSLNCFQHPLNKLLDNGFRVEHASSRPAERIETAAALAFVSMEMIQNEMDGGQSIPAFDYFLAPYVKKAFVEEIERQSEVLGIDVSRYKRCTPKDYIVKDVKDLEGKDRIIQLAVNRTVNRVHQSMEAFIHNMNTIQSKSGNQLVFSSINYGTDTSPEGRCIIREILNSTYEGVGNGETAMFPVQIWKIKKGINFNEEDINYDLYKLSLKVNSKRFYPNYINLDATFNKNEKWKNNDPNRWKYEVATMGCRTRVFENRHGEKTSIARGNLSYVTINLPKIAIESATKAKEQLGLEFELGTNSEKYITAQFKKTVERIFMSEIEKYMSIAAEELYDRYKFQSTASIKQFPLLMSGMWLESENTNKNDTVENVIKHGTLSIGFIGLAECLIALTGKHHGEDKDSFELGKKIISQMKDLTDEFSEKYNLNFNLLATQEAVSKNFVNYDKIKYGEIAGVTDKPYYTNSNHLPVGFKCTVEEKTKIESAFHCYCLGGDICNISLSDEDNTESNIDKIIHYMIKYNMNYLSINHQRTRCLECGYETNKNTIVKCPKCNSKNLDIIQKITGYLVESTSHINYSSISSEIKDKQNQKI